MRRGRARPLARHALLAMLALLTLGSLNPGHGQVRQAAESGNTAAAAPRSATAASAPAALPRSAASAIALPVLPKPLDVPITPRSATTSGLSPLPLSAASASATPYATQNAAALPAAEAVTSPNGEGVSPNPTSGSAPSFSAPSFSPPQAERVVQEPAHEPGQLLVLWATPDAATSGLALLQQQFQLRPRQRYTLGALGFNIALYALPTEREALSLRDQLRSEQPDWVVDLNARSTPMQGSQAPQPASADALPRLYAFKMLGGQKLSVAATPGLRLGVVDTGLAPALIQLAALNGSTLTVRSVLGPADKPADTAHGSAVLQLLAGAAQGNGFAGAAPPLRLAWANAMRDINGKPGTNSLALALALDWLVSQDVQLINLSLGGNGDEVLKAVINRVLAKPVLVLAAVGNNPAPNAAPVYPAAYPGVWAITAIDAAGKPYPQASRATYTAMAAPGVDVWVPQDAGGSYVSGTSYATALASAAVAWQPASFWSLPLADRQQQVCAQAKPLGDTTLGCGLVQQATVLAKR